MFVYLLLEWVHSSTPGGTTGPHTHHQPAASTRSLTQRAHHGQCTNASKWILFARILLVTSCRSVTGQNGNTALSIACRLGYISVVDTLRPVTDENLNTAVRPSLSVWNTVSLYDINNKFHTNLSLINTLLYMSLGSRLITTTRPQQ